jgi:hypothetical protein
MMQNCKNPGLSSKLFKDYCTPDAGAELSFEPRRFVKAAKGRPYCTPSATDEQDGVLHLRDGVDPASTARPGFAEREHLSLKATALCVRAPLPRMADPSIAV